MRKLSESVWMDIHKQSAGDIERKENDVNLLDLEGLYTYFQDKYDVLIDTSFSLNIDVNKGIITFPVFRVSDSHKIYDVKISNKKNGISLNIILGGDTLDFYKKMKELYSLVPVAAGITNTVYEIYPKTTKKITNKFVIEVIDFILENISSIEGDGVEPIMKKKKLEGD